MIFPKGYLFAYAPIFYTVAKMRELYQISKLKTQEVDNIWKRAK